MNDALWGLIGVIVGGVITSVGTLYVTRNEGHRARSQFDLDNLCRLQDAIKAIGEGALLIAVAQGRRSPELIIELENRYFSARMYAERIEDDRIRPELERFIAAANEPMMAGYDVSNLNDWLANVVMTRMGLEAYVGSLLRGIRRG